jgi:hypothetical protein
LKILATSFSVRYYQSLFLYSCASMCSHSVLLQGGPKILRRFFVYFEKKINESPLHLITQSAVLPESSQPIALNVDFVITLFNVFVISLLPMMLLVQLESFHQQLQHAGSALDSVSLKLPVELRWNLKIQRFETGRVRLIEIISRACRGGWRTLR